MSPGQSEIQSGCSGVPPSGWQDATTENARTVCERATQAGCRSRHSYKSVADGKTKSECVRLPTALAHADHTERPTKGQIVATRGSQLNLVRELLHHYDDSREPSRLAVASGRT